MFLLSSHMYPYLKWIYYMSGWIYDILASSPIGCCFTLTLFCLLPLFQLLTIFVSAKLASYMKFYQNNKDFIDSLGK